MSICIYDNDNDNDIANTCIICSVIFELQNVKMVLKMALNFYYRSWHLHYSVCYSIYHICKVWQVPLVRTSYFVSL